MKKKLTALILLGVSAVALPAAAAPPPVGVYGCYGQNGLNLPLMFGLLDGTTYANYDGNTGHYVLSGDVLVMTDGPFKNIRYQRTGPQSFRMLDANGALTAFVCPKEGSKDPHRHPW